MIFSLASIAIRMPRAIPQRRAEGSIVFPKSSQGDPSTFYPITTTTSHTLEPKQTDSYLIEYLIAILNTIATLLVFGAHTRDVHTLSWIVLFSFNLLHERDLKTKTCASLNQADVKLKPMARNFVVVSKNTFPSHFFLPSYHINSKQ